MSLIKYDDNQLKVPTDYGIAKCLNCGGELNQQRICTQCGIKLDAEDTLFINNPTIFPADDSNSS